MSTKIRVEQLDIDNVAKQVRDRIGYLQEYNLKEEVLSDDIKCDDIVYDYVQGAWRIFGEVRIAVPRRFDYYLSITIAQRFDEGNITVGGEVKPISDNMTFQLGNVDEVVFSVDVYIWVKAIAVQGFRPIFVPTKVSQLENDLEFVSASIEDRVLKLKS